MRRVERVGDLREDRQRALAARARRSRSQQRLEVAARDEAHRQEEPPVVLARLVDRDDVRVVERRRQPRLLEEAACGSARPRPARARPASARPGGRAAGRSPGRRRPSRRGRPPPRSGSRRTPRPGRSPRSRPGPGQRPAEARARPVRGEPAGARPSAHEHRRRGRRAGQLGADAPEPLSRQRSDSPTTSSPAPCASSMTPRRPGRASSGSARTPAPRWTISEASASRRLASRPSSR